MRSVPGIGGSQLEYLEIKILYWAALSFLAGFGLGTISGLCLGHFKGAKDRYEQNLGG
jgi:hypothetical protein